MFVQALASVGSFSWRSELSESICSMVIEDATNGFGGGGSVVPPGVERGCIILARCVLADGVPLETLEQTGVCCLREETEGGA